MADNELQTVAEISDLFTRAYVSPNTANTYGRALAQYLEWLNGRHPFDSDPRSAMETALQYRDHVMAKYAVASTSSHLAAIKSFYRLAKSLGVITINVWELVKSPTPSQISSTRALSPEKIQSAYVSAEALGPRDLLVFRLLYEAALRREEVATLPAEALEWTSEGYALRITGKGDKTALVGITDDLAHEIQQQILRNPKGCAHVFPGYSGKCISVRHVNTILEKIDPEIHPHQLRHTHATEAIENGNDLIDVSRTLRHSSIQTTMRYVDRRNAIMNSTARKIGRKNCEKNSEPETAVE